MKLGELEDKLIYAYRPRTSDSSAQPAKVVEATLWRRDEVWANWDGSDKRTKETVVTRAKKGDRAGRSDAWTHKNWAIGVPVLVIEEGDHRWHSAGVQFTELPFVIFARAWEQMNPDKILDEDHDGRFSFTKKLSSRTTVDVPMSDGTTQSVTVRLEFVRPQTLIEKWNPYIAAKKETAEQERIVKDQQAERRRRSNLTASSIRNKVDALLGSPGQYDHNAERLDLHRKSSSTGISTTYEVSEETLLKLLALAEKGSQ